MTFAAKGEPVRFSFGFGSCLYPSRGMPMTPVGSLLHDSMSFFLLISDSVYADPPFNHFTSLKALYRLLAADSSFSALTSSVPLFIMFDDHEISNNWDRGNEDALHGGYWRVDAILGETQSGASARCRD